VRRFAMPLYMDIHHKIDGLTAEAIKGAHEQDVKVQKNHGVTYHKYWFDAASGKAFCLVQARKLPTPCIVKHTDWSPTRSSRCRRELSQAASSPLAASSRSVFATPAGWPRHGRKYCPDVAY
jgi:hypothetical protein